MPRSFSLGAVGHWTLRLVVLALALIGLLHLTRGTAVRHVRGVGGDGAPISIDEPEFPLMATMATGAWMTPGNQVEVTRFRTRSWIQRVAERGAPAG